MSKRVEGKLEIENARIMFRNFAGEERPFNPAGKRNFCVVLDDPDLISQLKEDGWNVKERPPRDEEGEPLFYLPVEVSYKQRPPIVQVITSRNRTNLNEDSVEMLDYMDIQTCDLVINPYNWDMPQQNASGVKAYLGSGYFVINEDRFAHKYDNLSAPDDDDIPFD